MKKFISVVTIIFLCFGIIQVSPAAHAKSQELVYTETADELYNPERGYYYFINYKVQDDYSSYREDENGNYLENAWLYDCLPQKNCSLIELQFSLDNYRDRELTDEALEFIDAGFNGLRHYGKKAVLRFMYDANGAGNCEPDDFDLILRQIGQLSDVLHKNKDVIYVVEAGFLGSCGEWHTSKYTTYDYRTQLVERLMESVPNTRMILVRTPSYYRNIIGTDQPVTAETAFNKSNASRLGIHNDGYLGNATDYGTYASGTREQELLWQKSHTAYTPFGGEAINPNEYNDFEYAIYDMSMTHCSYLNMTHDTKVKDKWKEAVFQDETSVFDGMDGESYIKLHLGYRYVMRSAAIPHKVTIGEKADFSVNIENVGFGNMYNERNAYLIFDNGTETHRFLLDTDPRFWSAGEITQVTANIDTAGLSEGEWDVYISLPELAENLSSNPNYAVKFANQEVWNSELCANKIGSVVLEQPSSEFELKSITTEAQGDSITATAESVNGTGAVKYCFYVLDNGVIYYNFGWTENSTFTFSKKTDEYSIRVYCTDETGQRIVDMVTFE